ncbi:radical SAM family heme chaperone HemW [Prolixibacteraceae bacterium]|nr:radical SAM family heme chaperone HemW [Prolixibacteraceae bacterium]
MSGIYFHIPFCKTRCFYCDFHTSTNLGLVEPMFDAMKKELSLRKDYLMNNTMIHTIYFGGGTPSLLTPEQIGELISLVKNYYVVSEAVEITVEANPDDLSKKYLRELYAHGVNRLSIGVQSTNGHILKEMNRRHGVKDVFDAVYNALEIGINNISIDLIYGVPNLSSLLWKETIDSIISLPITHISAYHLTYHEGTVFHRRLTKGQLKPVDEHESLEHYEILVNSLKKVGFEQYEISNFCKDSKISNHNSSYWNGASYLGIGPSAHSYDGNSRQWNIADNKQYIDALNQNKSYFEEELLSNVDKFNDYIITSFRTKWGVQKRMIESFGSHFLDHFVAQVQPFIQSNEVEFNGDGWEMTSTGFIRSDLIIEKVFYCEQ